MLKRIPEKGDFWQPVSGGYEEEDKSLQSCAIREACEEAGVRESDIVRVVSDVHLFQFATKNLKLAAKNGGEIILTEFAFGIEVTSKAQVDLTKNVYPEHSQFRWVDFDTALDLLKWEENKTALKKLNAML